MESPRRHSWPRSTRWYYRLHLGLAAVGVAVIVVTVFVGGSAGYFSGGGLLLSSAGALSEARRLRRRERLYGDQPLPAAGDEVLALAWQGQQIEAIKRYRKLHPGIGLREAKDVIDGCAPGGAR